MCTGPGEENILELFWIKLLLWIWAWGQHLIYVCYEQYNFMFHFILSFDFHFIDIMFDYSCIFNLLIDGEAWPAWEQKVKLDNQYIPIIQMKSSWIWNFMNVFSISLITEEDAVASKLILKVK